MAAVAESSNDGNDEGSDVDVGGDGCGDLGAYG